ncbi:MULTISPECIES: phage tail assembly chaperone [Rhodoplanes]|nr:phage tail assembly chaperone [Rhodoplanes serenus]
MRYIHFNPLDGVIIQVIDGGAAQALDGAAVAALGPGDEWIGMRVVALSAESVAIGPPRIPVAVLEPSPDPQAGLRRLMYVRTARNAELDATDVMVVPDRPMAEDTRSAWLTYRAALRDLGRHQTAGEMIAAWPARPDGATRTIDQSET